MGRLLTKLIVACYFVIPSLKVVAHPGIGMVYDGNSTIYYTDLEDIWKFDITVNEASVLIPNIHSHELCLDSLGNLYGEHYFYVEKEQKFKNYIWKYSTESGFSIIRKEQDGENTDFSFIRDAAFNPIQFSQSGELTEIIRVIEDSSQVVTKQKFQDLRWKSISQYNELFLVDLHSLYRIGSANRLELIAKDLSETKFPFSFNDEKHNVYGVWSDEEKNSYVAIYGGRQIKRIDELKNIQTVYQSSFFWSPLNGLFDKEGQLWVMEGSLWGDTRILKIEQSEVLHSFGMWLWVLFSLILLVSILMFKRSRKRASFYFGIH